MSGHAPSSRGQSSARHSGVEYQQFRYRGSNRAAKPILVNPPKAKAVPQPPGCDRGRAINARPLADGRKRARVHILQAFADRGDPPYFQEIIMDAAQTSTVARELPPAQPDFAAIKAKQQDTWASGDFAVIGTTLQIVGESLAEAIDVRAGERVLDVAAGNGNASLAAAHRFAQVTSTDYVPSLLEKGAARAQAEGLQIDFQVADAEDLPFADGSFDVVLSTFGVMFTPEHTRPAREMLRVVRDGGRIGLANWTPEGFIGQLFKVIGADLSPPGGTEN